jgi:cytosine/creatinine deaminase
MLIRPGTAELMERALEMGVETVGGLDPAGIDNDPIRHLETIFDLAGKHGRGVDIHLHDGGELGIWQIERIADFTQAGGLAGKVMISHAFCLGMVPTTRIEALGRRLADLRISLMTTAPSDISLPPVAFLKALGVNICCDSDGIRDAWSQRHDRRRTRPRPHRLWPGTRPRREFHSAAGREFERRASAPASTAHGGEPRDGHRPRRPLP